MKLGACYNIFNGDEHLLDSIKSIRRDVDFIAIVYQSVSYYGNSNESLQESLDQVRYLVDCIVSLWS